MIVDNATSSFADATADITDPENLELAQATFNERLLYEAIVAFATAWSERAQRPARIVDLCAATGLTAKKVSEAIPVDSVTLVDNCPHALAESRKHFSTEFPIRRCRIDAVTFSDRAPYDIILANSAYHHIEDDRKAAFLKNAARLLSSDGVLILGDHFLPPYDDEIGHARSTEDFYRALINELEKRGTDRRAIEIIRSAAKHGAQLNGEYKVCWSRFAADLDQGALCITSREIVWSYKSELASSTVIGSVALQLQPLPSNGCDQIR